MYIPVPELNARKHLAANATRGYLSPPYRNYQQNQLKYIPVEPIQRPSQKLAKCRLKKTTIKTCRNPVRRSLLGIAEQTSKLTLNGTGSSHKDLSPCRRSSIKSLGRLKQNEADIACPERFFAASEQIKLTSIWKEAKEKQVKETSCPTQEGTSSRIHKLVVERFSIALITDEDFQFYCMSSNFPNSHRCRELLPPMEVSKPIMIVRILIGDIVVDDTLKRNVQFGNLLFSTREPNDYCESTFPFGSITIKVRAITICTA